jgi:O-6-methylguanine DNA methyltransferase
MRAVQTRYAVPGWGVGELWTLDGVVLEHELEFDSSAVMTEPLTAGVTTNSEHADDSNLSNPPKGAHGPPSGTVSASSAQVGHGFVPGSRQSDALVDGVGGGSGDATAGTHVEPVDPDALVERIRAFLAGADVSLADVPIDLTWCTPFQHAVADTLRAVPRGEVVSYGELAALAGYPGAARAAGTFCARNRFMLIVPCHRVVGAAGIGDYGSAGVAVKRRLLALEGVRL